MSVPNTSASRSHRALAGDDLFQVQHVGAQDHHQDGGQWGHHWAAISTELAKLHQAGKAGKALQEQQAQYLGD